jgi:MFS family permease
MCYVLSPASSLLIAGIGWRASYLVLGTGTCLILLAASLLIVSCPEKMGLEPYGAMQDGPTSGVPGLGEWETTEVMRNRNFWLICGIHASHLFAVMTLAVHLVIFATDVGISEVSAAAAWFLVGLCSIAGRIAGGYAGEAIGYKRGFIICGLANTVMLLWLIQVDSLWMLLVFVPFYGFFYGAETPMLPGILGNFFGLRPLATLIGTMMLTGMLTGTIAPFFAGFLYDALKSYLVPFGTAAAFWAFSAFLAFLLRKPAKSIEARS